MKKITISILALAAVSTAALANGREGLGGRERSDDPVWMRSSPAYRLTAPLAVGIERAGKSNYEILREKAAADPSGGPGVNN